jgi:hypothetical protein
MDQDTKSRQGCNHSCKQSGGSVIPYLQIVNQPVGQRLAQAAPRCQLLDQG